MSEPAGEAPLPVYTIDGAPVDATEALGPCTDGRAVDGEAACELLLAGGILTGRTLISGVMRDRTWTASFLERLQGTCPEAAGPQSISRALKNTLEQAASASGKSDWLISLSGGLDSRIIAAAAAPWHSSCNTASGSSLW